MDEYADNEGKWDEKEEAGTSVHHKKNNVLPLWGNERSMNLNPLILTNIQSSHYFKVNLYELKTYHEVIDEIYYKVNHLEPWEKGSRKTAGQTGMCGGVRGVGAGGIVSTAFCLLYKLFTLKLTRKQVIGLITHPDSPYIRVLGFMYIRYTQPPADLWDWYEPYLDDTEELDVKAGGGQIMAIGNILKNFLCKLEWFSTLFPRIPVPIQQKLEKKMNERYPPPVPSARRTGSVGRSLPAPRQTPEAESYSRGRSKHSESGEPVSLNRDDRSPKRFSRHRSGSRDRYKERRIERSRSSSAKNGNRSTSRENQDRYRSRDRFRDEERGRRDENREHKRHKHRSPKYDEDYREDKYRRDNREKRHRDEYKESRKHKDEYISERNQKRSSYSPERHRTGKKKKTSAKPRKQDVRRTFRVHQKAPVKLSRYYVEKAIAKANSVKKKKKLHPLIENFGEGGRLSLNECVIPSVNSVLHNLTVPALYSPTSSYLLTTLRKSMLCHNWTYSLRLYQTLLEYGALNKRFLLYILRVILILLLNSDAAAVRFDEFMSVTLGMKDEKLKTDFSKSILELKKLRFGGVIRAQKKKAEKLDSEDSEVDDLVETRIREVYVRTPQ